MADHALGAANGQPASVATEDEFDGLGLGFVTELGAGAVSVDVLHILRLDAGVLQGQTHGSSCAAAFGMRRGDVMGVAGAATTEQFGVNDGAALASVFQLLE